MSTRLLSLKRIPFFMPLAGATLMLGVAMSFTAPYLSLFSVERAGMTPLQLGLFMTVIASSGVAASALAGRWSDRRGHHRELLMMALGAAALGFLCLCFVRNYLALLLIALIFLGAGGSALSLVFSFGRVALPVADEAERAFATASLRTVLSMAWVFGPSIGALLLAAIGFYGLFLFAAVSFILCGVIVYRIPKTKGPGGTPAALPASDALGQLAAGMPAQETANSAAPLANKKVLWRAVMALTLLGLAANATMIVLPLYIVRGLQGTRIDVSVMLGLGAFLEIPMMLALGAKSARLNKLWWLAACAAVHVVYFIAVAAVTNIAWLIPMQALSAFVVAVTSCLGMMYVQDLMPRAPGAATALFFNAARVGSILSGVLSGVMIGAVGYRGTFLCCGFLAAVALWLFADPKWQASGVKNWRNRFRNR